MKLASGFPQALENMNNFPVLEVKGKINVLLPSDVINRSKSID